MARPMRDPFGPIEWIVTAALTLFAASMVIAAVWAGAEVAATGSTNIGVAGFGDDSTCAEVSDQAVISYIAGDDGGRRVQGIDGFDQSAGRYASTGWSICLDDPSWGEAVASKVAPLGSMLLPVAGLLLVWRVIRAGRREGLFVDATANRVRDLGWFLVGYAVVWPFVVAAAAAVIVDAAVRDAQWYLVLTHPDLSFSMVFVALGVLSVARILRRAVPMQQEIDTTV